ncbi:hypothetical protein [Frankia sp. Cas3]|uniref:hypothetical protein n=1 Tax=Frankia sp. Cas3 TaxID=3073926 RepID=UPI002AD3961A|nr:hypothetical protein [Frankia sp. Cas3]
MRFALVTLQTIFERAGMSSVPCAACTVFWPGASELTNAAPSPNWVDPSGDWNETVTLYVLDVLDVLGVLVMASVAFGHPRVASPVPNGHLVADR